MTTPEDKARETIDQLLTKAGWSVQEAKEVNLGAVRGVALRNFALEHGHGFADYLLYIDGKAAGVVEAKKEGHTLTGVEIQSGKYSEGLPPHLPAHDKVRPFGVSHKRHCSCRSDFLLMTCSCPSLTTSHPAITACTTRNVLPRETQPISYEQPPTNLSIGRSITLQLADFKSYGVEKKGGGNLFLQI